MQNTRLAIHGAAGRMGKRLVALASADPELRVAAALESSGHPQLGQDAGLVAGVAALDVPLHSELNTAVDALIDFSVPAAAQSVARLCAERGIPLVMATTGLDEAARQQVQATSERVPVVFAPSMSLAVNVAMKLCRIAGESLRENPTGVDVEILERHHRFKEDAPSGTALRFGRIIADAMGQTRHIHGREGMTGQRPRDEIGYHAIRVGDNPGEHTIVFGLLGESIEVTVRATNRDCYALGALAAARFVTRQPPGLYTMDDVLGL